MSNYRPNLSDQQVRFCDEYLVSFNAYRAAIAAGYSENTAAKGELLHIPKIQEYLKLKMDRRAERLEISHDMILREYAKIAFSSMANYYDENGDPRPMCEISERDKAAISQYEIIDMVGEDGYKVGKVTKIKLHNKMSALDKIARHLGFYEKTQESRCKTQDVLEEVAVEDFEEVAVAVAVAVEEDFEKVAVAVAVEGLEEVAAAVADFEEGAAAVAVGEEEEVVEETAVAFAVDQMGFAEQDQGGKILTLSPLFGRDCEAWDEGMLVAGGADEPFFKGLMVAGVSD